MAFEVVRSRASEGDVELIFDYLLETYQDLGDSLSGRSIAPPNG